MDHHETHHEIGHQFDHETGRHLPETGGRHATLIPHVIPIVIVRAICVLIAV
ncbi:hypothetical protein [Streptomyces lacrimifluminis]|uniref:hypothetical protein n=1 Tax=Streptomyces lacrimifluminis TaxID=1500077 RepID=UPI001665207E|nr:hypothetical protein [Streptomyces lacrimifluminis]